MHVIATAGHVDHGKSTLVRALTGMEPDRWAEERRRGLTIDLGFVWSTGSEPDSTLAFVDVPGHERFVPNMLAGTGPVPAVLFVVAADGGWMPQSREHLSALEAFGVGHGVLAVTRADLADPTGALAAARTQLAGTALADVEAVACSAVTGGGLPALRSALLRMTEKLPRPDGEAAVRLWVDRSFSIAGAGTVVTGTLPAGTLRVGDQLDLHGRRVVVRALQSLGQPCDEVAAVARVAVNLRGVQRSDVRRGDALTSPEAFLQVTEVDVWLRAAEPQNRASVRAGRLPEQLTLHVGSASVVVRVRVLGAAVARLSWREPLPLRVGDRCVLRDAGSRLIVGAVVRDVAPPALRRRGQGRERARQVAVGLSAADVLTEHRWLRVGELEAMGLPLPEEAVRVAGWVVAPAVLDAAAAALRDAVDEAASHDPLSAGLPLEQARRLLGFPTLELVGAVVRAPLESRDGRIHRPGSGLPTGLRAAAELLRGDLLAAPFAAPDSARLVELGLGAAELAALARAGLVLRLGEVVLLSDAPRLAVQRLAGLDQPFTVTAARQAWTTSRRVALPLLAELDRRGLTRRLPDDRRVLGDAASPTPPGAVVTRRGGATPGPAAQEDPPRQS